jgi:hypothetical protein
MKIDIRKISDAVKKTKRKIFIGFFVFVIVVIGVAIVSEAISKPSLEKTVFFYKVEGESSKLSHVKGERDSKHLIDLPSEKIGLDKYKPPRHSYVSNNGRTLIYFERIAEIPIETISKDEGLVAYRIVYEPKYVDLQSGSVKNIEEDIDSGSLVFSPDDKKIAWILRADESTIQELEAAKKKRELWTSNPDGKNAKMITTLDEKVVLLQGWYGDYIYFLGIQGVGYYSLGKINVNTGRIRYVYPKYCSENLSNCQNFKFSSSGELFIYEAGLIDNGEENIGLFVEDWNRKRSWQVLANNYISDRLWLPGEEAIIYTEQLNVPKVGIREKIHLVTLKTGEDKEIYLGSYVSQLVFDASGRYLYFLEKETDDKFNLVRLDIKKGAADILTSAGPNQLKIFSNN